MLLCTTGITTTAASVTARCNSPVARRQVSSKDVPARIPSPASKPRPLPCPSLESHRLAELARLALPQGYPGLADRLLTHLSCPRAIAIASPIFPRRRTCSPRLSSASHTGPVDAVCDDDRHPLITHRRPLYIGNFTHTRCYSTPSFWRLKYIVFSSHSFSPWQLLGRLS